VAVISAGKIDFETGETRGGLFVLVAEVRSNNPRFEVFERAQIFNDIAPGIVEKQLAIFGATDRDNPFQIVAIFKQVIDRLGHASARDDRNFRSR